MSLKAVIFDFNGVIIKDEPIHEQLTEQLLIEENLTLKPGEYRKVCLGRSDRTCLQDLLATRGRVVSETYLTQLLKRKAQGYVQQLQNIENLPLYPGLESLLLQIRSHNLKIALVSGAIRQEIDLVLNHSNLAEYFEIVVTGDDITVSKPEPDSYLLVLERLNQEYPGLDFQAQECLVIEDTLAGIQAAKRAGMRVVGVANTYPFHMLQRCCNWTVDYLSELELEQIQEVFSQKELQKSVDEC
jgi:HAD superfamily hydrolase (TIGR01509 family)